MEEACDSHPDESQAGGQTNRFSQLPEGASASAPLALLTPTQAESGPEEGISSFITRASASVARKFGNPTSSLSEVGASTSGVALEEDIFTSPVHTAGNLSKRKGEPLVDILFYHKQTEICRGCGQSR